MFYEEMPVEESFVSAAAKDNEIAVVVIGRAAGEDRENKIEKGSWYLTDVEEKLLSLTRKHFKKLCVIINSGSIMDVCGKETYNPDALMLGMSSKVCKLFCLTLNFHTSALRSGTWN